MATTNIIPPPTTDVEEIVSPNELEKVGQEEQVEQQGEQVEQQGEQVEQTEKTVEPVIEDDKYIKNVYLNLKDVYGDNFTKTEEDFYNEITNDKSYAEKVYLNLKDVYGDNFTKTQEDFYNLVLKKKDISEESSEKS